MNIGCHVSIAGGIFNAPQRASDLGAACFQIFTRSPQGGKAPELTSELLEKFKSEMQENKIESFVIHTPYYVNFASANNRVRYGSVSVVRDELERASLLGAKFVMSIIRMAGGDRFSRVYRIGSVEDSSDKGDFYNLSTSQAGYPSKPLYQAAEGLYNDMTSGDRKLNVAADENPDGEAHEDRF